jgi:flagellar hook-basal body complex protein FliE
MNIDEFLDSAEAPDSSDGSIIISSESSTIPKQSSSDSKGTVVSKEPNTFKSKAQKLLQEFKVAESKNDVDMAVKIHSKMSSLANDIPSSNTSAQHAMHTLLVQMHNRVDSLLQKAKEMFKQKAGEVESKIRDCMAISQEDPLKAESLFKELETLFASLPAVFVDQKHALETKVLSCNVAIHSAKQDFVRKDFAEKAQEIKSLLNDIELSLQRDDFSKAKQQFMSAQKLYSSLPEGFVEEKSSLHAILLKKKHTLELTFQIESLQKELDSDHTSTSTSKSTLPKAIYDKKHEDSQGSSNRPFAPSSSIYKSASDSENKSVMNDVVKKIKLGKIRIALLDNNIKQAKALFNKLLSEYTVDTEIQKMQEMIRNFEFRGEDIDYDTYNSVAEDDVVEKQLSRVQDEFLHGNIQGAEADLETIRKNSSKPVSDVVYSLEQAIANPHSTNELNQRLNAPKPHEAKAQKLIDRNLRMANHYIKQDDHYKAKKHVLAVLNKDPTHREAKKLLKVIS